MSLVEALIYIYTSRCCTACSRRTFIMSQPISLSAKMAASSVERCHRGRKYLAKTFFLDF